MLKIVRKARPKVVFVLENVYGMPAADRDTITKALGVTPVRLVSTSTCTRLFSRWAAVLKPLDPGRCSAPVTSRHADAIDTSGRISRRVGCGRCRQPSCQRSQR